MAKINPRREKQAANDLYADRFRQTRTSRKHRRRKQRRERVQARELAWLRASGIERDERWPLA